MKNLFFFMLALLFSLSSSAQTTPRSILVEGAAKREVIPDIIFVHISIKEYEAKPNSKVSLNELEKQLIAAVKKQGLATEKLQIANIYGYNFDWKREKNKDFMARKEFMLELSNLDQINSIISAIDPKGIEHLRVGEATHSKLEEIKSELQAEAVLNAKSKAEKMLVPLNEKLGKALEISEQAQGNYYPVMYKNMAMADDGMESSDVSLEFKEIKLEAKVLVKFEIE